ncbi:MAG: twin-arginine translocase TatA/TatE family subunit [Actinomycetota bacterium]|nr:twin-arginine translocase TatA/TatE family subunit [Actinomycetota bacterium]MDA8174419.1 twin-arginine translocase TatA/TatE family subunit [Nitrospiraceae bacterium]
MFFRDLFQPMHILVILALALLLFGPGRLPEIGSGLGRSIKEFKKALSGQKEEELEVDRPADQHADQSAKK